MKRYLSLEQSLHVKGRFDDFAAAMEEYFTMGQAEEVPVLEPPEDVFYLPMHAVRKESSTTTQTRVVFDVSAKSSTSTALNDMLLVGPTVHSPLIDMLLQFQLHCIALMTDVSRMYRAVVLIKSNHDLHQYYSSG